MLRKVKKKKPGPRATVPGLEDNTRARALNASYCVSELAFSFKRPQERKVKTCTHDTPAPHLAIYNL